MYSLNRDKILIVLGALLEGQSIRSVERITGVHRDTIMRWMVRAGSACQKVHDKVVCNVHLRFVQADEMWSFIGKKDNNFEYQGRVGKDYQGELWVFIAIDADSKLVLSYRLGTRTLETSERFLIDLKQRVSGKFQLNTDGFVAYKEAVERIFGADMDYGQLVKLYSGKRIIGATPTPISGQPDLRNISTSFVERNNLTVRMGSRRFTRKTNGFSKRVENHLAALQLHFAHYNFVRIHKSLRMPPALAAGITDHVWTTEELVGEAIDTFGHPSSQAKIIR